MTYNNYVKQPTRSRIFLDSVTWFSPKSIRWYTVIVSDNLYCYSIEAIDQSIFAGRIYVTLPSISSTERQRGLTNSDLYIQLDPSAPCMTKDIKTNVALDRDPVVLDICMLYVDRRDLSYLYMTYECDIYCLFIS